jgi:hypothetical protein
LSDEFGAAVAALAVTPEQLDRLFTDKLAYWELAGFTSLLVQGRGKMQPLIDAHRDRHGPHTVQQVDTVDELDRYFSGIVLQSFELVKTLERAMNSHLPRLFGDRVLYDKDPTRQEVVSAAKSVTDFYRAILVLVRQVRGVTAPHDYTDVLDNLALLIGHHLETVDTFITGLIGLVTVMPSLARNNSEGNEYHSLALELDPDYALLDRIKQQIKHLRQPWRRWFRPRG